MSAMMVPAVRGDFPGRGPKADAQLHRNARERQGEGTAARIASRLNRIATIRRTPRDGSRSRRNDTKCARIRRAAPHFAQRAPVSGRHAVIVP
jgi:hypothetical protein